MPSYIFALIVSAPTVSHTHAGRSRAQVCVHICVPVVLIQNCFVSHRVAWFNSQRGTMVTSQVSIKADYVCRSDDCRVQTSAYTTNPDSCPRLYGNTNNNNAERSVTEHHTRQLPTYISQYPYLLIITKRRPTEHNTRQHEQKACSHRFHRRGSQRLELVGQCGVSRNYN